MFGIAILCLVIAFLAYAFGEARVGEVAIQGAKIFAVIGIVLVLLSVLFGWGWWPIAPGGRW